jgi:hypothetical protein
VDSGLLEGRAAVFQVVDDLDGHFGPRGEALLLQPLGVFAEGFKRVLDNTVFCINIRPLLCMLSSTA